MSLRSMLGKVTLLAALAATTVGWAEPPRPTVGDDVGAIELDASTAAVGSALLKFEANVKWAAVSKAWAARRAGWVAGVKAATTPAGVSARLRELEASMGWSAVQDSWRKRRDGWVREAGAASTDREVARLLLELETTTKWSAVEARWKDARDAWVANLTRIARS